MLRFFGRGSSSNFSENNTSAYFIEDQKLFVIDASEVTARQILSSGMLERNSISETFMCVTHTHGDHFSGCGTLAGLLEFEHNIPLRVILDCNAKHVSQVEAELKNKGINGLYVDFSELTNTFTTFIRAEYVPTTHSNDGVFSHGILFETQKGIVYYSGDTNEISRIVNLSKEKRISQIYVDTSSGSSGWHISLKQLEEGIPFELRKYISCMHIDQNFDESYAANVGFKTVFEDYLGKN